MKVVAILAFIIGIVPFMASAADISGNELHEGCENKDIRFSRGVSFGYILGVYDSNKIMERIMQKSCVPPQVTYGQIFDVACKFVKEHPEGRHIAGTDLIVQSLREAWPCPK